MEKNKKMAARIFLTLAGTYGVCAIGRTAGMDKASYTVFAVFACLAIGAFWRGIPLSPAEITGKKTRRRRLFFAGVTGFLFSLSMFVGYQLQNGGLTDGGFRGRSLTLLRSLCLSAAVFPLWNFFFGWVEGLGAERTPDRESRPTIERGPAIERTSFRFHPAAVFGICAAGIFVCLIPVWLAYYPIVMSYDFHRQVNEAHQGFAYFYPYQPIAHTWVIWVFLQLGRALGSLETGFACMALFQMLLYALVAGYACSMLYRLTGKVWPVAAAALFFGVFPFNSVMILCTTKDVFFTVLFLLFFLLLMERELFRGNPVSSAPKRWIDVLLVAEGCVMMQFRNNAFYAVAVFSVLYVFLVPKKEKLRALLLCLLLIAGGKGTELAVKRAIGTELSGSKVEMFSVPIQQFARVGFFHGGELDEFTALKLDGYIPWQDWSEYNPPLADTVKSSVRSEKFEGDYGSLFSFWAELGLQYPGEYLDAFLELTRGYWFLDDLSWAEYLSWGVEGRRGAIFTYNSSEIAGVGSISHESKLPWLEAQLEKIVSGNSFYDWPVISLPFRSAFYPWSLFLITMAFLYTRRKRQLRLSLLLWMYFGTVLLGPVAQLRYVFPFMVTLPPLLAMLFAEEK